MRAWLAQDYVSRYLGDPEDWLHEIVENLTSGWIKYFIAETDRPVGFLQYYHTGMAPAGPWSEAPVDTAGIDFLIGDREYLGKGYGAKMTGLFVEYIRSMNEFDHIVADPDERNIASVKTLQKCGFKPDKNGLYRLDLTSADFEIFRAKKTDAMEIAALFRDTIRNVNSKDYSKAEIEAWSSRYADYDCWESKISEQYFLKAVKGDRIVGFASLRENGYIDYVFTHKDYQGRGIATELTKKLEKKGVAQGFSRFFSEVSLSAKSFFEKNGFAAIKRQKKRTGNEELINFMMEKSISNLTHRETK